MWKDGENAGRQMQHSIVFGISELQIRPAYRFQYLSIFKVDKKNLSHAIYKRTMTALYHSPEYQVVQVYNGYEYQISYSKPNDQSSIPSCFREEEFLSFTSLFHCDPQDGASFDPRGII